MAKRNDGGTSSGKSGRYKTASRQEAAPAVGPDAASAPAGTTQAVADEAATADASTVGAAQPAKGKTIASVVESVGQVFNSAKKRLTDVGGHVLTGGGPTPVQATPAEAPEEALRNARAETIVKNNVIWAAGAGLLPIPVVDVLAQSAVQMKMISELAMLYGVDFTKESIKSLVAALLGGTFARVLSTGTASFLTALPIIGQTVGAVTMSLYGGAVTYALGQVFMAHFKGGGTLLDFDPQAWQNHFNEMYDKAVGMFHKGNEAPAKPTRNETPKM